MPPTTHRGRATALELNRAKTQGDFDSEENYREAKQGHQGLKTALEEFAAVAGHNFLVELVTWLHGFVAHFQRVSTARRCSTSTICWKRRADLLATMPVSRRVAGAGTGSSVDDQDTDPVQTELVLRARRRQARQAVHRRRPETEHLTGSPADIEMYAGRARRWAGRARGAVPTKLPEPVHHH